jgi:hypothetical protein
MTVTNISALNPAEFSTIDDIIARLTQIRNEKGNLIVAVCDDCVGYPATVNIDAVQTIGYDAGGFFKKDAGGDEICVIGLPC